MGRKEDADEIIRDRARRIGEDRNRRIRREIGNDLGPVFGNLLLIVVGALVLGALGYEYNDIRDKFLYNPWFLGHYWWEFNGVQKFEIEYAAAAVIFIGLSVSIGRRK